MQLQQRNITNVRAGILQSQKFSVEMNGVLFRTTIDGIYSDKKRAPLRELCMNAWDASPDHRFDIHLPSLIDPRVIVRHGREAQSRREPQFDGEDVMCLIAPAAHRHGMTLFYNWRS